MKLDDVPSLTVPEICDRIGRKRMQRSLNVGRTAISNACIEGRFPAKWFRVVRAECAHLGISVSEKHFSFLSPPSDPDLTPTSEPQYDSESSDQA